MIGLMQMAMKLACKRIYGDAELERAIVYQTRAFVSASGSSANAEYYRIIDRLSRGEPA